MQLFLASRSPQLLLRDAADVANEKRNPRETESWTVNKWQKLKRSKEG